jgi:beta-phosphoglucomutase family hydrolase
MDDFTLADWEAILFDLDGVLTDTAALHAVAWKQMFDEFLLRWSSAHGQPFEPFEIDPDYVTHVDGLPRFDGVATFLESRRIVLPEGSPSDGPDADTIHGLGTRKNELVLELMDKRGVEPFAGTVTFLDAAIDRGLKVAVVSSSRNARASLESAGLADRFEVVIDGNVAAEVGLPGKPAPDTYKEAAKRLGVKQDRAVVVEDAIAGIEAGRLGNFGCVIGVDRDDNPDRLRRAGAHVVVDDMSRLLGT